MIDRTGAPGVPVICTQDGLWTLEGARVHASVFAGRGVMAGAVTRSRVALVVDHRDLWELAGGCWRRVATADRLVHSLLYIDDQALLVAGADGGLGTLRNHEVRWNAQIGDLAARGQWRTPWGGPPDIHTLTRAGNGSIYACVHAGWMIRSDDEGASWRQLRGGLAPDVHDVEPHLLEPTTLVVATAEGAYVSEDGGAHFARRWPGSALRYLRACAVFGKDDVWILSAHDNAKRGSRACIFQALL
ncbi:MAG: WD40/YVTN/BNR-like repeat-containing protein [Egibacteraceae bacterium]